MEKVIELAGNIIDKLKVKEIIVALLIAGTFILYAFDNILSTLDLEIWTCHGNVDFLIFVYERFGASCIKRNFLHCKGDTFLHHIVNDCLCMRYELL